MLRTDSPCFLLLVSHRPTNTDETEGHAITGRSAGETRGGVRIYDGCGFHTRFVQHMQNLSNTHKHTHTHAHTHTHTHTQTRFASERGCCHHHHTMTGRMKNRSMTM